METVINVVSRKNYHLEIKFSTGEIRLFDARPYLTKGLFCRLQDEKLFMQAYVALDTVCVGLATLISPRKLFTIVPSPSNRL